MRYRTFRHTRSNLDATYREVAKFLATVRPFVQRVRSSTHSVPDAVWLGLKLLNQVSKDDEESGPVEQAVTSEDVALEGFPE